MTLYRIDIDTAIGVSQLDRLEAAKSGITDVINLCSGIQGGAIDADFDVLDTPIQATSTLTLDATGQVADETFVICGVTFTAKDSGATGPQFDISTTDVAVTAANIAVAVEASVEAALVGVVTTTSALGVVTFTCDVPGLVGNGLALSESLTQATAVDFTGGTNGTSKTLASK